MDRPSKWQAVSRISRKRMAKLAALPYAFLPVVAFFMLACGRSACHSTTEWTGEQPPHAVAEGTLTSASRCAPTPAAHGGTRARLKNAVATRSCAAGLLESKTSIRRMARLSAATSSDDANPANAKGKECVNQLEQCNEGLPSAAATAHAPRRCDCPSGVPKCGPSACPTRPQAPSLPATAQHKLPSCNLRSLQEAAHVLAEVSSRGLLRGIRDAVAVATREPRRQVLVMGRDATTDLVEVPPKEVAAARFSEIRPRSIAPTRHCVPLDLRPVVLMSQLGITEGPRPRV